MRGTLALVAAVAALALVSRPAMAQGWLDDSDDSDDSAARLDISASAGGMLPTHWSNTVLLGSISSASGAFEQVLARDLSVEPNTNFSAAVTYWRGRYGFRTQAGFARSSLRVGGIPMGGVPVIPGDVGSEGVDTFIYGVGGAIGFVDYRPERHVWPYGFFGIGGITYRLDNPVTPPLAFVGSAAVQPGSTANSIIVVAGGGRQFVLGLNSLSTETMLAFNFGIGTDFRLPLGAGGVGLRVEVADHVSASPVSVQIQNLSGAGPFVLDSAVRFPTVHQFTATAGVVVHIGG